MENEMTETEIKTKKAYIWECIEKALLWCQENGRELLAPTLIEWDETQNARALLDYDQERNYRRGLIHQAQLILSCYTRATMKMPGQRDLTVARLFATDEGFKTFENLSSENLQQILSNFGTMIRNKAARIREYTSRSKLQSVAMEAIKQGDLDYRKARRKQKQARAAVPASAKRQAAKSV